MGNTPVILAFNKFALVPRLDEGDLLYLQHAAQTKGVRCLSAHAISATQGRGIDALAEAILDVIGKRNLIVCGGASVGKSTLINQLAPRISDASARFEAPRTRFELQISADRKVGKMNGPTGGFSSSRALREASINQLHLTESHLPGTTLGALEVACFSSWEHSLYDTHGVLLPHSLTYSLFPAHAMAPMMAPTRLSPGPAITLRPGDSLVLEAAWMDAGGKGGESQVGENGETAPAMALARVDTVTGAGRSEEGGALRVRLLSGPAVRLRVVRTEDAADLQRLGGGQMVVGCRGGVDETVNE